ncbi:MAG TPA: hypothetical protein VGF73_13110 [Chthoniobacterales bacterium]
MSTPSAEGAIHYSGRINEHFNGSDEKTFPLVPGASLFFEHIHSCFGMYCSFPGAAEVLIRGGSIAGYLPYCRHFQGDVSASNLDTGATVAQLPFSVKPGALVAGGTTSSCGGRPFRGGFRYDLDGYIGFRFDVGSGVQYGWARVSVRDLVSANFRLLDYAYADPGEPIRAGQKAERDAGPVQEESLGALAFGAAGVLAWRRRRDVRSQRREW